MCAELCRGTLNTYAALITRLQSHAFRRLTLARLIALGYTFLMSNIKAALVGGLLGILSTLGGVKLAHADCDYGMAKAQALDESEACEVDGGVFQGPEGWTSYCSSRQQLLACEFASELVDCSERSDESCDVAMGEVYEACLVLAWRTGAVH